jgi:hypothetical protein
MCCFITSLFLFGPRIAILVWWLVNQARFALAFDNFILPLLGFLFLPWTLIFYLIVFPGGVNGFDWVWLAIGLLFDISTYSGGGFGNRDRLGL